MASAANHDPAYDAGYADMMRMHALALRRGWRVPERLMILEIMRLEHSASAPTGQQLPMLDQPLYPEGWYRGRADAIRAILREQAER